MAQDARPLVLASRRVVRVPDLADPEDRPKVIDVPMTVRAAAHVTRNPGANTAGTKRASDINVKSAPDWQDTEPAYRNLGLARRPTYQRVGPRTRSDGGQA